PLRASDEHDSRVRRIAAITPDMVCPKRTKLRPASPAGRESRDNIAKRTRLGKSPDREREWHGRNLGIKGPSLRPFLPKANHRTLDHDAITWKRIMLSSLCLSMIFSENRFQLCANAALRVRITLWRVGQRPVEPKPPPRSVAESRATSVTSPQPTPAIPNCAIRSPRLTRNGVSP